MYCLESTFLSWKEKFEPRAKIRPPQVKEASVKEATMTPDTMGTSASMLMSEGIDPRIKAEKIAVKKGSKALIVCVKLTATEPKLAFVKAKPKRCRAPKGSTATMVEALTCGAFFSLVPQITAMQSEPTAKWISVHTPG
mmetsp:Transcript_8791/g.25086  ORF Transcript_8791/g.25086 Transcript_8791/m.25086 type:complete len:139 (+) Transcript_8791:730-1146(+)